MKKLLIFVLLFAFIFTKANLREGTIEKKNFKVTIVSNSKTDYGSITKNKQGKNSMNSVANTKSTSFLKKLFGWLF